MDKSKYGTDKQLESKLYGILKYFYSDLFKKIYLPELQQTLQQHDELKNIDKDLLETVILVWTQSIFFIPILSSANQQSKQKIINVLVDVNERPIEAIKFENEMAVRYVNSGVHGVYNLFYAFLDMVDGSNNHESPKDPFTAPIFNVMARQLIEAGENCIEALEENT